MSEQGVLTGRGIGKRFGPVVALEEVAVAVCPGEVLALAGENGSGKSTLAKVLAGVHSPDTGVLSLDGKPVAFGRPRDALDAGIALVAQELSAVRTMTVGENVLLTRLHRTTSLVSRRRLAAQARPLLRLVGLDVDPMRPFATLPPGQRELVELAKALAAEPRVLILDEATTRLPEPEDLFRLVQRLCSDDGLAVVFITQRLREIRRLADRALILRDGRVAGELKRGELTDRRLASLMVGRDLSGYFHKAEARPGDVVLRAEELVTDRSPHPVSLTVRSGEIVGLAGLVGAGRTELLETVAGVREPRSGRVVVRGRRIRPGSIAAALRAGVTLLPEDRHAQGLVLGASVRANLAMPGWRVAARTNLRQERFHAATMRDRLRIRCQSIESPVRTLSGGNQQKVVIARCLSSEPRVLILDEPTRGVDVGAREEIYAIIGQMVQRGVGVLLASSDLPELLGLCDRIAVLSEGRLTGELDRGEATEERLLLLAVGDAEAAA